MAEVVAGAFLSSFLNVLLDRMASRSFIEFFETQEMDMELFDELKILLNTVSRVLDDAEDRQITDKTIKTWLDELRDAAYDADDLLGEFHYEVMRLKVEAEQQSSDASAGVNFSKNQQKRMEKIVRRLKSLVKQSDALRLKEGVKKYASSDRAPTTSVVEESDVFGRDEDKEAIFELLLQNDAERSDIDVIPIVGMGGIGKTTLAQLVYNDSRAEELFEIRAWVCVSENYNGFRIKKEILKHTSYCGESDHLTPNQIDVELRKSLKDTRYLLVLDDMWNDKYADWNDNLLTPLKSGARGSKIIVTTRNQSVASTVCTVPTSYELHELDAESCSQLFVKHAFDGRKVDQSLEVIGKEIVEKCQGLPLAAKMLGGLLRRKREVREWKGILKSNLWDLPNDDNILPALRLSYQHLPSHLKQCFSYLAIIPKDHFVNKEHIVQLWMAEGFLVQTIGWKEMEELGEECLDELVSRSFLQLMDGWDGQPCFYMHDLINDLAKHVSGEFLVRMEGDNSCKISRRSRHLSYITGEIDSSKIVEAIAEAQSLRTFLSWRWRHDANEKEIAESLHNQIPQMWRLRVLSLHGFSTVVELLDLLCNLKQLRHLNLAETSVERLPESVCTLYNLQILILFGCSELVELPTNMRRLINLRCLDVRETPRLREMPPGLGNLKELRSLSKFFIGKQYGANINDLDKLRHLQELSIFNLQNVVDTPKNVLTEKEHLEDLKLEWNGETSDSAHERSVLDRLQPYINIKELSIYGYGGTKFPDWVGDASYTNIVCLKLKGCKNCISLPTLGQLPFLEDLSIQEFDAVVEVGAEFCKSCSVSMKMPFNSLKSFHIGDISQWEDWVICVENDSIMCESFPNLKELTILGCPKLKSISTCEPTHKIFKSLNKFYVEDCPNLKTSNLLAISNFKTLERNDKGRCVSLVQSPSAMYRLSVGGARGLEEYNPRMEGNEEMLILFNALDFEEILIYEAELLQSIPSTVLRNLTFFFLYGCSNLKSLPQRMHDLLPSLECLAIAYCNKLESFPEGGLPAKLQSLEIIGCEKLVGGRLQWGLQRLHALSQLLLSWYFGDDLDSFPEQTLLPSTLSSLKISSVQHLKFINYDGLQHLTSLAELEITYCPNLQCLPEEGLPSSLSVIRIWDCPLLEVEKNSKISVLKLPY